MSQQPKNKRRLRAGRYLPVIVASFFLASVCTHCAIIHKRPIPTQVRIKGRKGGFKVGTIFRPETGEVVSFEKLLDDLRKVRIAYIGEMHASRAHHLIQLKVLKALSDKRNNLLVGMEMFEASYQSVLDQWSAGLLDETSFLKAVDWEKTWKFDFSLYRPILEFIRKRSLKLVGLNVPASIVEKVAREGLDSLSKEERSKVARKIFLSNERHRAYVKEAFKNHRSGDIKNFDFFYQAQCVWDESMAEAIADAIDNNPMVVLAGNGHIAYRFGIPDRVLRRTNTSFRTIMPVPVGTEVKPDIADYVWVTPLQVPRRSIVGIRLKCIKQKEGILIEKVVEGKPAALAGIKGGDVLLAIDGRTVSTLIDVHRAMTGGKKRQDHIFKIKRDGRIMEFTIHIEKNAGRNNDG